MLKAFKYRLTLIKNYDGLAIKDLAVSNMLKNHKLAQFISNAGRSTAKAFVQHEKKFLDYETRIKDKRTVRYFQTVRFLNRFFF